MLFFLIRSRHEIFLDMLSIITLPLQHCRSNLLRVYFRLLIYGQTIKFTSIRSFTWNYFLLVFFQLSLLLSECFIFIKKLVISHIMLLDLLKANWTSLFHDLFHHFEFFLLLLKHSFFIFLLSLLKQWLFKRWNHL